MRTKKPKPYVAYTDFDVIEAFDELFLLLENLRSDLYNSAVNGGKSSGIRARKGLKVGKELLENIIKNSLPVERAAKAAKKPHGNKLDPKGIKVMLEKRNLKLKEES